MAFQHREQYGGVRTKIVATIGPASTDPQVIRQMVDAGADVFRLNFSHGTHETHTAALEAIRGIASETGMQLAVLQDLCGPKIRLGEIPGDVVACDHDADFVLTGERGDDDNPHHLTSSYGDLVDDLEVGQSVLFADGTVAMDVVERMPGRAVLKVSFPGRIRSHQGINVPSGHLSVPALTAKDLDDLDWTAAHEVDYIGLSFVRQAKDIARLRGELVRRGSRARIVAKVEKPQAVENLDRIVEEADAVMIARGDLGVELDVTQVPAIQKRIIETCQCARVPVITATQMLNSMEASSRPTRAEASDVFNAVLDGTDALMLSGETAIGQYPVESVAMMSRITGEAERLMFSRPHSGWGGIGRMSDHAFVPGQAVPDMGRPQAAPAGRVRPITEGVVESASLLARRLNAALLVVETHTGRTALAFSKQRNQAATLAIARDLPTARAMALFWGVTPVFMPMGALREQIRAEVHAWCRARALASPGDLIVRIGGTVPGDPTHNEIEVYALD
jgi:pyruvate kinase